MVNHNIQLIPQRETMSCWEAAAAMLIGGGAQCLSTGGANANPTDGMEANDNNIRAFAHHHGLFFHPSMRTLTLQGIQQLINRGPVWTAGMVPSGHAYVIGGYSGTQLHIFDPWPVNQGRTYWTSFSEWMNKYPLGMVWFLTPR